LLDQNGNEIYRFQEARNMRPHTPNGNLVVGNALDGSIGEMYLCMSSNNVPSDPSTFENCLINTEFSKENVNKNGSQVINSGTAGNMNLIGSPQYILRQKTIGNPGYPLSMGVFTPEVPNYDGISCNDEGYTAAFEGTDSSFQF